MMSFISILSVCLVQSSQRANYVRNELGVALWPGGIIPYVLPPLLGYTSDTARSAEMASRQRIMSAFAHYHRRTPIRFVPRDLIHFPSLPDNYAAIQWSSDTCASFVGLQGARQTLDLTMMAPNQQITTDLINNGLNDMDVTAGCSTGDIIHELGHLIGFSHKQQREDRDQYLDVVESNLRPPFAFDGPGDNYAAGYAPANHRIDIGDYDYGSIMHYEPAGEAVTAIDCLSIECAALVPKKRPYKSWREKSNYGHDTTIGQRDGLSHGDLEEINLLYGKIEDTTDVTPQDLESGSPLNRKLSCGFGGSTGACNWENGFYYNPSAARGSDFPFMLSAGTNYDPYAPKRAATSSDEGFLQFSTKYMSAMKTAGQTAALYSPVITTEDVLEEKERCIGFHAHLAVHSRLTLEVISSKAYLRSGNTASSWKCVWDSAKSATSVIRGSWNRIQIRVEEAISAAGTSPAFQIRLVAEVSEQVVGSSLGIDAIEVGPCT